MTIKPPNIVWIDIGSFKKIQTHIGPRENSSNINNVTSEAEICLVAKINAIFTKPESIPPQNTQ